MGVSLKILVPYSLMSTKVAKNVNKSNPEHLKKPNLKKRKEIVSEDYCDK